MASLLCLRFGFPAEGLEGGDEDEPEFEEVGEEEQDLAVAGEFEGDDTGEAVSVEGDGDVARHRLPAEGDDEEGQHVRLVQPLVEALVVVHAAEVQPVAQEEVGQVEEEGDEGAGEGPAEDGKSARDADGCDDPHLGRHGGIVGARS